VRVVVTAALDGERVDRLIALVAGVARAEASTLVDNGAVTSRGRPVTARSHRVHEGDELEINLPERVAAPALEPDASVDVSVVYVDVQLIVVDKPAGMVVHPGSGNRSGTLVQGLLARFPDLAVPAWPDAMRPGVVHRLDKGTSGLLVVARTAEALVSLAGQLKARTVERRYLALVWGVVEADAGVVDAPLGRSVQDPMRMAVRADGRRAVTRYEVVHRYHHPSAATLLGCRLETGRTHQIRVHLAAIGHPVAGDDRYRGGGVRAGGLQLGRPFLHAERLAFDHPATGERLSFTSPLPDDLARALDGLS
jgi:23S rRNA pseudouridine1911/1915/1917 synthase